MAMFVWPAVFNYDWSLADKYLLNMINLFFLEPLFKVVVKKLVPTGVTIRITMML